MADEWYMRDKWYVRDAFKYMREPGIFTQDYHHADTRIIRGHRLPISRYRDKLSATYRGQIAVLKIVDFFYNIRFS